MPIPLILMTILRMFAYVQPCLHYIGAVFVNQLYLKRKKNIEKNKQKKKEKQKEDRFLETIFENFPWAG